MISTVIFDMDGTLIDTEKYYHICWMETLEHFGYPITHDQAYCLRSLGRPFVQEYFRELYGPDFDYDKIHSYCRKISEEIFAEKGIELKPGALEILKYLKEKDIPAAVATATDLERTTRYLKELGIYHYFERIISARMVECGKPAPDVYLYACRELGVHPSNCIAVEDSPNGVMSAYRAGCKVVMVPDQTQPDEAFQQMLYKQAESLADLVGMLS